MTDSVRRSSAKVALLLMGASALTGCWDENPDDKHEPAQCTDAADSDVDCMPPDGDHSAGTKQAYFQANPSSGGSSSNAFMWYWLGRANSQTVYVAPPAAAPRAYSGASSARPAAAPATARGGFGAAGSGGAS